MKNLLLQKLRDRSLSIENFREFSYQLACHIAEEKKNRLSDEPILVIILRAGIAMLSAFLESFPKSPVGFIGLARDEKTAQASLYYKKLPDFPPDKEILILEPMIATGGSANLAMQTLQKRGVNSKKTTLISFLAAPEGLSFLTKQYPFLTIETVEIDQGLDPQKFIVPGIGDFGDRFFGNVS